MFSQNSNTKMMHEHFCWWLTESNWIALVEFGIFLQHKYDTQVATEQQDFGQWWAKHLVTATSCQKYSKFNILFTSQSKCPLESQKSIDFLDLLHVALTISWLYIAYDFILLKITPLG